MLLDTELCAMESSSAQASPDVLATALQQALELRNPPAKFGGFLLMGAVRDFYEISTSRPLLDQQEEGRTVLVEAVIYVHASHIDCHSLT